MIGFIIAPFFLTPLSFLDQPFSQLPSKLIHLPFSAHLGVFYMAIISGIIAYYLFQYGLQHIEASEATVFQYLGPVFSTPLAVIWLHDKITPPFLIGAVFIVIGVFTAEYKPHRRIHTKILRRLAKNLTS